MFKPFGNIARIFLAKDKVTGQCKGFAFVNYYRKEDAAKAIATLNGYGYVLTLKMFEDLFIPTIPGMTT